MNFVFSVIGAALLGAIATWAILIVIAPGLYESAAISAILIGAGIGLIAAIWSWIPRG